MGNVTYSLACDLIRNGKIRGHFTQSEIDWMSLHSNDTALAMSNFAKQHNGLQLPQDPQEALDREFAAIA